MFEFQKVCKQYEKLSYDERRALLEEQASVLVPAAATLPYGIDSLIILVMASCAADGKLQAEEYSLFKDVTGLDLSYDLTSASIEAIKGKEIKEAADIIVDSLGEIDMELKALLVSFCLLFCSADGRVGLSERSFIKKLVK